MSEGEVEHIVMIALVIFQFVVTAILAAYSVGFVVAEIKTLKANMRDIIGLLTIIAARSPDAVNSPQNPTLRSGTVAPTEGHSVHDVQSEIS